METSWQYDITNPVFTYILPVDVVENLGKSGKCAAKKDLVLHMLLPVLDVSADRECETTGIAPPPPGWDHGWLTMMIRPQHNIETADITMQHGWWLEQENRVWNNTPS